MNFLAHFLLAKNTSESRVGNFLGDFVKGTPESLTDKYPQEIIAGIIMHRKVDVFTDSHASFHAGKLLLNPARRRFAGIVLDIFTDHFLAMHWNRYSDLSLSEYNTEIYDSLKAHWKLLPEDAKKVGKWMCEDEWFEKYASIDGIEKALIGMSRRKPNFEPIADSIIDFKASYDDFQIHSQTLLKDAINHFDRSAE